MRLTPLAAERHGPPRNVPLLTALLDALPPPTPPRAEPSLFVERWRRALLTTALSTATADGPVDTDAIVCRIASGQALSELPRLPLPTLRHGVQLLIDRRIQLTAGQGLTLPMPAPQVEIATLAGTRRQLSQTGPNDQAIAAVGIDFSAVRAAHRPLLARSALLEELLQALGTGPAAPAEQARRVYLSYVRKDRKAAQLARVLRKRLPQRFELWDDTQAPRGKAWEATHRLPAVRRWFTRGQQLGGWQPAGLGLRTAHRVAAPAGPSRWCPPAAINRR